MGFLPKGVWIMDYCGFMGYGIHFSANQLGGPKKVWGIREYGLLVLWVKRELTVLSENSSFLFFLQCGANSKCITHFHCSDVQT